MRKLLSFSAIVLSAAFLTTGCGSSQEATTEQPKEQPQSQQQAPQQPEKAAGSQEKIEFGFGHVMPMDHPEHLAAQKFAEILDQKTSGRIKVNVYPAAQMGGSRELMTSVMNGSIEMVSTSTFGTVDQQQLTLSLPYLFKDFDHVSKFVESDISNQLLSRLDSQGVHGMGYWMVGFRNVGNSKHPIKTPEDMKGLLLRVYEDEMLKDTIAALGANATVMPVTEVYTALQTGTIDGEENPYAITYTQKFFEGYKYKTETRHLNNFEVVAANLNWWNSLAKEDQELINGAYKEATVYYNQLQKEADEKYKQSLLDAGMEITEITDYEPWIKAVQPVYDKWEKTLGADLIKSIKELGW
ncbi:TRAP transporter substrate-binding protein [Ammoniphilus resinae]|uniref:Tripartite ATP-independent transporter DctP family solute receptor n=1 Tax=Ammoniphilus resinae TaxID=861532 RepID=A0ABS4GST8_9BACL|nr:TRAP transporter substrate-binding protein [Ammoniphilus resinae]MBP1933350.1 tripartite ATP-independent transporter DctP family solute receptor [Ammoniphilus resinae]